MLSDAELLDAADDEAARSEAEGGLPIGSVVVDRSGAIVARSCNQSVQRGGEVLAHAELEALRSLKLADLGGYTLVTTLPPCWMCAGATRFLGVSRLVVTAGPWDGGSTAWLAQAGVEVAVVDHPRSAARFDTWRRANPDRWRPHPDAGRG